MNILRIVTVALLFATTSLGYAAEKYETAAVREASQAFREQRFVDAQRLLEPEANSGNPLATYLLGILYFEGRAAEKNVSKAITLFEDAAKKGHTPAYLDLAFAYQQGDVVDKDYAKALSFYRKAYEGGEPLSASRAAYAIGGFYLNGLSVPEDKEKAKDWYSKSSKLGFRDADKMLDQLESN